MDMMDWAKNCSAAITVCDKDGVILYLNDASVGALQKYGGAALIGKSLYDCHKPESCEKIRRIMSEGKPSIYTIEKKGVYKMFYQAPWYREGRLAGIVEIEFEIPNPLPHFVR
jgi:hypothetical protein